MRPSGTQGDSLRPTRLRVNDVLGAALRMIAARPARALLTAAGTVVGTAALVATISLTATAQRQIADAFAALEVNEVLVTAPDDGVGRALIGPGDIRRMSSRADVREAGTFQQMDAPIALGTSIYASTRDVTLQVVDPALMPILAPTFVWGRGYDARAERGTDRIVLLPDGLARELGLHRPRPGATVVLGGHTFAVGGVYRDVATHNELLLSPMIPPSAASRLTREALRSVAVFTSPGAAPQVAQVAAEVLSPYRPEALTVLQAPAPERLRQQVDTSVRGLLLLLAVVALGVSGLGIANTTLMAVMERAGEIGLKRALGARRRHIAAQTIVESGLLGLLGAVAGVWLGVVVTVFAAAALRWQAVLDLRPLWIGPLAGLAVGVLAGLYPALRAASLQPAEVLKR